MSFVGGCLGLGLWTAVEYLLHRFVGHGGRKVWLRGFRVRHLLHHRDPRTFDPAHEVVIGAVVSVLMVAALWSVLLGVHTGVGVAVGYGFGFVGYEIVHRWVHSALPAVFPLDRIRVHHLAHHDDPTRRYGITTTVWDAVARTG